MSDNLVIQGRYADHTFIPEGPLPDTEGAAELIITPNPASATHSIFDLFGKAVRLKTAEEIATQIQMEHDEWGEP